MIMTPATIKVYQSLTLPQGAELALRHRLYIAGWALSQTLHYFKISKDSHDRMALAFCDHVPVAVAVLRDGGVQAFCRKSQRRQGHAGACVRALRTRMPVAHVGIPGSQHFWNQLGVMTLA